MGVDINTAFGKKGGNQITFLISLLIVVAIVVIAVKIYKGVKSGSKIVGDQLADVLTSGQTGISVARLTALRASAAYLWDTGTDGRYFFFDYDEDLFISAINACVDTKELGFLNTYYSANHVKGFDIKFVVKDAFNSDDKNRLRPEFRAYLGY